MHGRDGAADVTFIKVDSLYRISLTAFPIELLKPMRCSPGDGTKLGVIVGEGAREIGGAGFDEGVG
jgi:hypothetical protein